MSQSPIVDEVRRIRESIAAEHDFDLRAIFTMLKQVGLQSGKQHVHFSPKRIDVTEAAQQALAADERRRSPSQAPSGSRS